jgi:phosphohistidine phosphatase
VVELYLMQHGLAVPEAEDPSRPLSEEGQAAVEQVVARARSVGVRIAVCLHSGKLRAEQTAQALAIGLEIADVRLREGLNPSDAVAPFAAWLTSGVHEEEIGAPESLVVVGHLPFLDRLASSLVCGSETAHVVRFQNAGLVKLVPKQEGAGYSVSWALVPELA